MLDRQKHEQILKNILRDIYTTPALQGKLAFKGGTCLYMFYALDRFSVDLDFNVISPEFPEDIVNNILKKYITINDQIIKIRTGKTIKEYFIDLIDFIEKKVNPHMILEGLGELITDAQKDSIKSTLIRNLLFDLKSRI